MQSAFMRERHFIDVVSQEDDAMYYLKINKTNTIPPIDDD